MGGCRSGEEWGRPITLFDASKFKTTFACEVKEFDVSKYIDKKEARRLDRYAQFAMVAAEESIADSKLDVETVNKNRVGVIIASGIGGLGTFEEEVRGYDAEAGPRFNPFFIPKMISDISAGQVSMKYGSTGPTIHGFGLCFVYERH